MALGCKRFIIHARKAWLNGTPFKMERCRLADDLHIAKVRSLGLFLTSCAVPRSGFLLNCSKALTRLLLSFVRLHPTLSGFDSASLTPISVTHELSELHSVDIVQEEHFSDQALKRILWESAGEIAKMYSFSMQMNYRNVHISNRVQSVISEKHGDIVL